MHRWLIALSVFVLAVGAVGYVAIADEPLTLENRVSTLEALHGIDRSTPTNSPNPSATATNTSIPTNTPSPTNTPVSGQCSAPAGTATWHSPSEHEHGDRAPVWADAWSCAQFGWPVVFGGDEQTPNENAAKHNAFKGYSFTVTADDGQAIDLYLRLHSQTNPHGRMGRWHSYELYAARGSVVLGFWQGHLDFGASPSARHSLSDSTVQQAFAQHSPANTIVGYGPGANPGYNAALGKEFWYAQQSTPGGWDPVVLVVYFDPSTYYSAGEEVTGMDQGTWQPTGTYGLKRRIQFRWIVGGSTRFAAGTQPYLTRNMDDPRGWFCSTPTGTITSMGSQDCAAGSLPQFISPAMPTIGDTNDNVTFSRIYSCLDCVLPN